MDRREALLVLVALAAAPLAAEAQRSSKVARIGYLSASLASNPPLRDAFLHGLRELVWNCSSRPFPESIASLYSGCQVPSANVRTKTCWRQQTSRHERWA